MELPSTVKQLIDMWPTRKVLADEIGTSKERVDKWAQTGSIPARFHAAVLRAARQREFVVTADDIVRLHDQTEGEAVSAVMDFVGGRGSRAKARKEVAEAVTANKRLEALMEGDDG